MGMSRAHPGMMFEHMGGEEGMAFMEMDGPPHFDVKKVV